MARKTTITIEHGDENNNGKPDLVVRAVLKDTPFGDIDVGPLKVEIGLGELLAVLGPSGKALGELVDRYGTGK